MKYCQKEIKNPFLEQDRKAHVCLISDQNTIKIPFKQPSVLQLDRD